MPKPWGEEFLCYQNEHIAIWCLRINKRRETSFHCHPRKSTGLVLLGGRAELHLIKSIISLRPLGKLNIFPRRFHKTRALENSVLFEVEMPVDKRDLIRLNDSNGRLNSSYEKPIESLDNVWFEDTMSETVKVAECVIKIIKVQDYADFHAEHECLFVFLRGGVIADCGAKIVEIGEFLDDEVLKIYRDKFSVMDNSLVMKISLDLGRETSIAQ